MDDKDNENNDILPELITGEKDEVLYIRRDYLGEGSYAKCYEVEEPNTGIHYAGKFISKEYKLSYPMMQHEVNILKKLNHENVVRLFDCFENEEFMFAVLELCSNKTMHHLLDSRRYLCMFEAKYFIKQIVAGVGYLHENGVVHRDLKLGNLLISESMNVKLCDFGFAIDLESKSGKSAEVSFCGTPNFTAPEVVNHQPHGCEVDVWALGCLLYTLLVGKPPFKSSSIENTYDLICNNDYSSSMINNRGALEFLQCTLQTSPARRSSVRELAEHKFLNDGFVPVVLPATCLESRPDTGTLLACAEDSAYSSIQLPLKRKLVDGQLSEVLANLLCSIDAILSRSKYIEKVMTDSENPLLTPNAWIDKWFEDAMDIGFCYTLCNETVGMLFADKTTLMMTPNGKLFRYFPDGETEIIFGTDKLDKPDVKKKINILKSLKDKIVKESVDEECSENSEYQELFLKMSPILKRCLRLRQIISMIFCNGVVQVNYLDDGIKFIFSPVKSVTFIFPNEEIRSFHLDLLSIYGFDERLLDKLKLARKVISLFLTDLSNQSRDHNNNNNNNNNNNYTFIRRGLCCFV